MIRSIKRYCASLGFEPVLWSAALLYLALLDPFASPLLSLCPSSALGIESCPGCGLGRSISLLFHGDAAQSIQTHFLGIPALIILLGRTVSGFAAAAGIRVSAISQFIHHRRSHG